MEKENRQNDSKAVGNVIPLLSQVFPCQGCSPFLQTLFILGCCSQCRLCADLGVDLPPWRCQHTGAGPQGGWRLFSEHRRPPQLSSAHPTRELSPQQIPAFPQQIPAFPQHIPAFPQHIPAFPRSRHGLWSTRCQVGSRNKLPARKSRNVAGGPLTPSGLGAAEMRCESRLLRLGPPWEGGMFAAPHRAGTKGGPREVGSTFKSCRGKYF